MSFNVSGGSNYISDGDLLAWVAMQQDKIYGDLKDSMDLSETRAQMASDANDIKLHLEEANRTQDFGAVDKEMQAFLNKYGSTPEFAGMCETIGQIAATVDQDWQYKTYGYAHDCAVWSAEVGAGNTSVTHPAMFVSCYEDSTVKAWSDSIDGKMDVSNKNDQLMMIHIQELKATVDQATQLGSTLIAGSDKTVNSVINNIG